MLDVADALPAVREAVEGHLSDLGLTRQRILATAVRLLDLGFFRIGSDRYTEQNSSYGLTTLLREHSRCHAGAVLFTYTGKHGKEIIETIARPAACRSLTALLRRRGGGDRLLAYWEGHAWHDHDLSSDDVKSNGRCCACSGTETRPRGEKEAAHPRLTECAGQRDGAVGLAVGEEYAAAGHRLQRVQQLRAQQGPARGDQRQRPGAQPVQRQYEQEEQPVEGEDRHDRGAGHRQGGAQGQEDHGPDADLGDGPRPVMRATAKPARTANRAGERACAGSIRKPMTPPWPGAGPTWTAYMPKTASPRARSSPTSRPVPGAPVEGSPR